MDLLILGAGGHGNVVREIAQAEGLYKKTEFLDDNSEKAIGKLENYLNFISDLKKAFVAIGNWELRKKWINRIEDSGYELPILIHPDASISAGCQIQSGTVIMAGAVIQTNVKIGKGCIISAGAVVDHDAVIGDYCHVNPGGIVTSMSVVPDTVKVDYGDIFRR